MPMKAVKYLVAGLLMIPLALFWTLACGALWVVSWGPGLYCSDRDEWVRW